MVYVFSPGHFLMYNEGCFSKISFITITFSLFTITKTKILEQVVLKICYFVNPIHASILFTE